MPRQCLTAHLHVGEKNGDEMKPLVRQPRGQGSVKNRKGFLRQIFKGRTTGGREGACPEKWGRGRGPGGPSANPGIPMSAVFGEGEKKDLRGFLTQCFLPALLSLFKLTPTLELTRYLQYSEFYSPICSAHGAMGQWRALMFHSGDNKVLQTDEEKEREKARRLLREAKRAKGSLQERRAPGGFRLYGRPARSSSVAQRACCPDAGGGDVGARAAPEPGCRLSEVRGSESQSRRGVGL